MSVRWTKSIAVFAATVLLGAAIPAFGQAGDVPRDHWAYEAVQDLVSKGLVKGYPPNGDFFGKRTVTRYEMATLVQRVLARVDELLAKKEDKGAPKPPQGVSQAQLDEIRKLVDDFKVELTVIRTDLTKANSDIAALQAMVGELKGKVEQATKDAAEAKAEGAQTKKDLDDLKETFIITRGEFDALSKDVKARKLSGYIQGRFEMFDSNSAGLFTQSGAGGTGQNPGTGGPAVGGPNKGFLVRRARFKFGGNLTPRTDWEGQLDFPSIGAVAVKDANITVTDLPLPNFQAKFGLFPPPASYELFASSSTREAPERSLAFSDSTAALAVFKTSVSSTGGTLTAGSVLPLWQGQDRDVGVAFTYNAPDILKPTSRFTLGVFNGEGRAAAGKRNENKNLDLVGRAQTTLLGGTLDVGASAYYGSLAVRGGPPAGGPPAVPVAFVNGYRFLGAADVRYFSPWGTTFRAEWIGGKYEFTPDRSQILRGNQTYGWYTVANHPINKRFNLAVKYNEFYPISKANTVVAGLGRMAYVRKTVEGGFIYQIDDATRFRLWYVRGLTPYDPSAAGTSPLHSRLGFITGEVQVKY